MPRGVRSEQQCSLPPSQPPGCDASSEPQLQALRSVVFGSHQSVPAFLRIAPSSFPPRSHPVRLSVRLRVWCSRCFFYHPSSDMPLGPRRAAVSSERWHQAAAGALCAPHPPEVKWVHRGSPTPAKCILLLPSPPLPLLTSLALEMFINGRDNIFRFQFGFPGQPLSEALRKFREDEVI